MNKLLNNLSNSKFYSSDNYNTIHESNYKLSEILNELVSFENTPNVSYNTEVINLLPFKENEN